MYCTVPGHDAADCGRHPLVAAVVYGLAGAGKLLHSLPAAALQLQHSVVTRDGQRDLTNFHSAHRRPNNKGFLLVNMLISAFAIENSLLLRH